MYITLVRGVNIQYAACSIQTTAVYAQSQYINFRNVSRWCGSLAKNCILDKSG